MKKNEFHIDIYEATDTHRFIIEEIINKQIGSDTCIVVYFGSQLIGYVDDYGTFNAMPNINLNNAFILNAEYMLSSITDLYINYLETNK